MKLIKQRCWGYYSRAEGLGTNMRRACRLVATLHEVHMVTATQGLYCSIFRVHHPAGESTIVINSNLCWRTQMHTHTVGHPKKVIYFCCIMLSVSDSSLGGTQHIQAFREVWKSLTWEQNQIILKTKAE